MARPKTYLSDTARINARRASWVAYKHRVRGLVNPAASSTVMAACRLPTPPAGVAWVVPNDKLSAILTEVRTTFPPHRIEAFSFDGGQFRIGRYRAKVNFQPELA